MDLKTKNNYIYNVLQFIIVQWFQYKGDLFDWPFYWIIIKFVQKYMDVNDRKEYFQKRKIATRLQGIVSGMSNGFRSNPLYSQVG